MAGIGFGLRKLFGKAGFFGGVRAFLYSSIVIVGPMAACIVLFLAAQTLMAASGVSFAERELFTSGLMYAFVLSQLLTGGLNMTLSRYIADQLFEGKEERVLACLYGAMALVLAVGAIPSLLFVLYSPLDLLDKLPMVILFQLLSLVWVLTVFLSATRSYGRIVWGFAAGSVAGVMAVFLGVKGFGWSSAGAVMASLNAGFLVMVVLFFLQIRRRFPVQDRSGFRFLGHFAKYPSLFLIGSLHAFGLYGHSLLVWGSGIGYTAGETFRVAPLYDVPVFYALLSILPSMVMFVVMVETSFFERYRELYAAITGKGTLRDITDLKGRMFRVITRKMTFIMEFQLFFTLCAILFGIRVIPFMHQQIGIYNILSIGNYFFVMMYILVLMLLYFDDRKGALGVLACHVAVLIPTTLAAIRYEHFGLSVFVAGVVGLAAAWIRITLTCRNLDYHIFCRQRLAGDSEKSRIAALADRLSLLNG